MTDTDTTQPPAPADDVTLPPAAAPAPIGEAPGAVLRKDPARRERSGLGTVAAGLAVAAGVVPVVVVAALLWPRAGAPALAPSSEAPVPAPAPTARAAPPALDLAGLRAAVEALPTPAAAPSAPASSPGAPLVLDPARVEAPRALMKKIAKARDVRREAGATGPELKKPFSVEELGGVAALKELGVEAGKRLLVGRDGKLVAPSAAKLPELVDGATLVSKERDEDILEKDGTLNGAPVRVMRRCVGGELLCVVDVVPAAGTPAAVSSAAAPSNDARAALLARIAAEEQKLAAWSSAAPSSATTTTTTAATAAPPPSAPSTAASTTTAPPLLALLAGLALALALSVPVARRLLQTSTWIVAATTRLRAGASGRRARGASSDVPAELAALEAAIDEAFDAMGDAEARAVLEEKRRARAAALAAALDAFPARVDVDVSEDAAFAEVAAAARRLVETMEARIVRWKSHVDVVTAPPLTSKVEERAQALAPLPPLLGDAAQRLLLVARLPDVPPKAAAELNALADALAARGRTAQGLLDALLLDAATDRPGARPGSALDALRGELQALAAAPTAPTAVAALEGLPPAEIAARLAAGRPERSE